MAELAAALADPRGDFAYSNCCEVNEGKPWRYDERFGWRYRPFAWNGQPQLECVAFDPSPASFSKIWFAPNHVRAWRADFYRRIGGHDPSRAVLDDQDILCRTFIHGRVKHIDRCLYVYHVHPGNTCRGDQNGFIQTETLALHDQYIYPLAERWCDLHGLRKIDLCGGINPAPAYESVDLHDGRIACFRRRPAQTVAAHSKTRHTSRSETQTLSGITPVPTRIGSSTARSDSKPTASRTSSPANGTASIKSSMSKLTC